ncbi:Host attachment protein [Bordetella sputigena]|uniref:host attachment family protein n=1 Tax=Bordetella sputigena TaxID=1416810 RepID=UPI0039EEE1DF
MWKVTIPRHAWIALCNGGRGLILQNDGDSANLELRTVASYEVELPPTRDLGAAPPGRVTGPMGMPRSAVEAPDLHERAEAEFLHRFVHALDEHTRRMPQARLIIVAPPRVLGRLRKALSPTLRDRLFAEIPRNVALHTVDEIKNKLSA